MPHAPARLGRARAWPRARAVISTMLKPLCFFATNLRKDEQPQEQNRGEEDHRDCDEDDLANEVSSISILDGLIIILIRFIAAVLSGFPKHILLASINSR